MDFIENAAGKYMNKQGGGGGGDAGGGDVDWSHLSGLAQQFGKADQQTQGELDPSSFKSFLGGFGGSGGAGGALSSLGGDKAGGGGGGAPDTKVIDKLLGQFKSETGENFEGAESQYSKLEEIAYKASGSKIPLPILKKMVSWKIKGLV